MRDAVVIPYFDKGDEIKVLIAINMGKEVRLTDAGRTLLVQVEAMLGQLSLLTQTAQHVAQHQTASIRLGCVEPVASRSLPQLLSRFVRNNPDVQVHVECASSDVIARLVHSGHLELGICSTPTNHEGILFEPLFMEELHLLMPAKHDLAYRERVYISDLVRQPLFALDANHIYHHLAAKVMLEKTMNPYRITQLSQPQLLVERVRAENGIGFYPIGLPVPNGMVLRQCADMRFELVMGVVRSQERMIVSPAHAAFLEHVGDLAAILPTPSPSTHNAPPPHLHHILPPDNYLLLRVGVGLYR